ncbi:hypothetical protein [Herbaspirillum seropedicae]|uniref:hypothetical protein n=1 Tax=Herbaspirillum seropedicae TaxID=964 RepID=UPI003D9791D6
MNAILRKPAMDVRTVPISSYAERSGQLMEALMSKRDSRSEIRGGCSALQNQILSLEILPRSKSMNALVLAGSAEFSCHKA